jgi:protein O-mannosyl-transferase
MNRAKTLANKQRRGRKRPQFTPPPKIGPALTRRKTNVLLCILLAGVTIALYGKVLAYRFVAYDDFEYVTGNPHIRTGLSWSTIKWTFTATYASNWHPLTWLSHAFDYQLFGVNPAGHHFENVLIHAVNAVLLYLLLEWMTKRASPSLLVAALFALHPLNVESVAWVAERKNVLSTLLFFLTLLAYVYYAQRPNWRRYLLVAALFAAGLMAKPMLVTLPFVLLLLDYWPLARMKGSSQSAVNAPQFSLLKIALEKIPWLVLSAASAWVTLIAQRTAMHSSEEFRFTVRIENALVSYSLYLWKMIWPARLAVFYPHPTGALPLWQMTLSLLTLVGITVLVFVFRSRRYLAVGWLWFLGTLVPVIGLVQVGEAAMSDRYAYIPLIGIFIMIAWSYADWAVAKNLRTIWQLAPALCAMGALVLVTSRQINYWDSQYDLWKHAAEVTAPNPYADSAAGTALMHPGVSMTSGELEELGTEQERLESARWHYEKALQGYGQLMQQNPDKYRPEFAGVVASLGNVALEQNQTDQARKRYNEALRDYRLSEQQNPGKYLPYLAQILDALGSIDQVESRWDDARQDDEQALTSYRQLAQRDPGEYLPHVADELNNLGLIDERQNRVEQARAHYQEALNLLLSLPIVDSRGAEEIAEIEAGLRELDRDRSHPVGKTK